VEQDGERWVQVKSADDLWGPMRRMSCGKTMQCTGPRRNVTLFHCASKTKNTVNFLEIMKYSFSVQKSRERCLLGGSILHGGQPSTSSSSQLMQALTTVQGT
jgi:hypothetical protein